MSSSSNYVPPWIPTHRPPPADPTIAGRIAMLGPVGKCLETALDELLAEEVDNSPTSRCSNNNNEGESSSNDNTNNNVKLDKSISRSILESYRKAVIETNFDHHHHERSLNTTISSATTSVSHNVVNNNSTMASVDVAPTAMLKGKIDHYNRIGGQWRIVVKNAVLKRRSLTMLDNGMAGRSCRRRTVLDWDDDNDANNTDDDNNGSSVKVADDQKQSASVTESNTKRNDDKKSDVSLGTIQILAYDDET